MKIKRKAVVRNLVIAMIVADGAGVYYVANRLNHPVTVDDADREEVARAADTHVIRFDPNSTPDVKVAPVQAVPELAKAEPVQAVPAKVAPVAAPAPAKPAASEVRVARAAPVVAPAPAPHLAKAAPAPARAPALALAPARAPAPIAARPVVNEARVAKAGLDRFPAPAFSKAAAPAPAPKPRVAKAAPHAAPAPAARPKFLAAMKAAPVPAPRVIEAPKPAKRIAIPTLASASTKKPVTLSTTLEPQHHAATRTAHASHTKSFESTFATLGAPTVETSVATGTAGLIPPADALAVATQIGPDQSSAPVAAPETAPAPDSAPQIAPQPTTASASFANIPALPDG